MSEETLSDIYIDARAAIAGTTLSGEKTRSHGMRLGTRQLAVDLTFGN